MNSGRVVLCVRHNLRIHGVSFGLVCWNLFWPEKEKNKPGRQAFVGKANFLLLCATEMKAVQTGVSSTDDLLGELENSFAQTNACKTRNIPTFGFGPLEGNKTTPC